MPLTQENPHRSTLIHCLEALGTDRVWRQIEDNNGNLIFQGQGELVDALSQPSGINFKGKTVADLGCNLGYVSFQAVKEGASLVHGYDFDSAVIQAATLLKAYRSCSNIHFFSKDILLPPSQTYDIAMLIDFIGKQIIAKGELNPLLDSLARYATSMLVITARASYRIKNDLNTTPEKIAVHYGTEHIQGNSFNLMGHIIDRYSDQWQAIQLKDSDKNKPDHSKVMLRFVPLKSKD